VTWELRNRHYGFRVWEGKRPVANFHEEKDAELAVRLYNDHVNADPDAPRGRAATAGDTGAYPGEAAAVEAALACADDNDWRALTRKTVTAMLAAARPEIAAAEGERIAQEIERIRLPLDYESGSRDSLVANSAAVLAADAAAAIARGVR
jgi:hypothetical protein